MWVQDRRLVPEGAVSALEAMENAPDQTFDNEAFAAAANGPITKRAKVVAHTLYDIMKQSFRQNALPGVAIFLLGLLILIMYYARAGSFREMMDELGRWKAEGGYLASFIMTAIICGGIPFSIICFREREKYKRNGWWYTTKHALFFLLYWGERGVEFDLCYHLWAYLFGDVVTPGVVATKVVMDQFVYTALYNVHGTAIAFLWNDYEFDFRRTFAQLKKDYITRVFSMLFAAWLVWIPLTTIMYALPAALQLIFANLGDCFFSLVLMVLSKSQGGERDAQAEASAEVENGGENAHQRLEDEDVPEDHHDHPYDNDNDNDNDNEQAVEMTSTTPSHAPRDVELGPERD